MRHQRWWMLISGAVLIAQSLGCTDGEPVIDPTQALSSSPAAVRWPRRSTPPHTQPTPAAALQPPIVLQERTVAERAGPITVEIEADPDIGRAPLTVQFRALVEGGTAPYTHAWDFGDGGQEVHNPTVHTYREPGAYIASVVVSDADGGAAHQDVEVQVDAPDDADGGP